MSEITPQIFKIGTLQDFEKIAFFHFKKAHFQTVGQNKVSINFDFRSGAKKSGHLDYPFKSYGPKQVRLISTHSNVPILKICGVIPDTYSSLKSLTKVMVDFVFEESSSRPM